MFLMLRDNTILGAASDISGRGLIRKRIMTASMHVTVNLTVISDINKFRFLPHYKS
jgi:hypothetical protein